MSGVPEGKKNAKPRFKKKTKLNPATRSSCPCVAATSRAWWYRRSCRGFQWFLFTNLNTSITVNISRNGVFATVSYIALLNPWWKCFGSVHFGVTVYEGIELQGDGRDGIRLKCQNYRVKRCFLKCMPMLYCLWSHQQRIELHGLDIHQSKWGDASLIAS